MLKISPPRVYSILWTEVVPPESPPNPNLIGHMCASVAQSPGDVTVSIEIKSWVELNVELYLSRHLSPATWVGAHVVYFHHKILSWLRDMTKHPTLR